MVSTPINSVWQRLTLSDLSLYQWRGASFLYRLVGLMGRWREGSWLLQWSEGIGAVIIALIIGLGPFVSTSLIGVLLLAGAIYWVLLTLSENGQPAMSPIHLLVLLYWGIATVAVGFSTVKQAAFSGWVKLTIYLILFALAARILRSRRLLSWLTTIFLLVALVVSAYGVRQEFLGVEQLATWNDPNSLMAADTRVYSYLGNPNLLGGYLLPAIALSIAAMFTWQRLLPKALATTMFVVNTFCLYSTDSRGAWIGMMALGVVFLFLLYYWWQDSFSPFWRKWLLPLVLGSFAILLILALLGVESLRLRVLSIFVGREDSSNNFRINVWESVLKMIRAHPWLGIGPGNAAFNKVYPLYMRPRFTALSAYSIFLEIAVETGLIGLGCFFWLLAVTFNYGFRQLRVARETRDSRGLWVMAAIAAMVGMLAHGLVDTVWYRPQIGTLWWLMVAIIASDIPQQTRAEEVTGRNGNQTRAN